MFPGGIVRDCSLRLEPASWRINQGPIKNFICIRSVVFTVRPTQGEHCRTLVASKMCSETIDLPLEPARRSFV